jgi:hypothetical protein
MTLDCPAIDILQAGRFLWRGEGGCNFNLQCGFNAKGRPTMRKPKIPISSVIIFLFLVGFLAAPTADAVEDYTGDWNGQ